MPLREAAVLSASGTYGPLLVNTDLAGQSCGREADEHPRSVDVLDHVVEAVVGAGAPVTGCPTVEGERDLVSAEGSSRAATTATGAIASIQCPIPAHAQPMCGHRNQSSELTGKPWRAAMSVQRLDGQSDA